MARRSGIERIAALYLLVETMQSLKLKIASSALSETEAAVKCEIADRHKQVQDGRAALLAGEREALSIASAAQSAMEMRVNALTLVKEQRKLIRDEALITHNVARLKLEQMQQLADDARNAIELCEIRRAQVLADDRYASRRDWLRSESKKHA